MLHACIPGPWAAPPTGHNCREVQAAVQALHLAKEERITPSGASGDIHQQCSILCGSHSRCSRPPSQPRSACDSREAHSPASGARKSAGRLLAAMAAQACSALTGQQMIKQQRQAARQPGRAAVQVSCSLRRSYKQAFGAR